jgi:hypothetical protein
MSDGEPLPRQGGERAVLVPEIAPDAPKPTPSTPIPPSLVLGYIDLAIRGVLEYDRYAALFLSPWWAVEDLPIGTSVWKRAVLERIPLRGALHWGHLYLVVSDTPPTPSRLRLFRSEALGGPVASRPNEIRVGLREGKQRAELILHPTKPDRTERLGAFAREVEVRFRRQMD